MKEDRYNQPIAVGETLTVRGLGRVTIESKLSYQGGFGIVYKGICRRKGDDDLPVAVKFPQLECSATEEVMKKDLARFRHETDMLKRFAGSADGEFPAFCFSGRYEGCPYLVMEWLSPVNLDELDTNDKRLKYISDVCYSVLNLHNDGYVHYDIKPSNVLKRENNKTGKTYVLVDFGSIHRIESRETGRRQTRNTISMLSNGARMFPHTPGYADPEDDLHTVNADIYAIGQVMRDLFPGEVPLGWAQVINKCTSRRQTYRYASVEKLMDDLERLRVTEYALAAAEDMRIWDTQRAVTEEPATEMSWQDLKWELSSQGNVCDEDYPGATGVLSSVSELFIDFGKLPHRNIKITTPVSLTASALLVIRGNGRISMDIDGNAVSPDCRDDVEGWDNPMYPFVILLDGATLDNRTKLSNEDAQLMYMVGRYCMLNFSSRDECVPAEDPGFILTGRAGYSFVGNGKRKFERGLFGMLDDGRTGLFAQQGWDEFGLTRLLEILRKYRRWDAQGALHDWLENHVQDVLMRNLGRYEPMKDGK